MSRNPYRNGCPLTHRSRLIQSYFDEISHDTGKICFGVDDTLRGLELGAVETLIVWENLDVFRHTLRDASGKEVIVHSRPPSNTAINYASAEAKAAAAAAGGVSTNLASIQESDRAKFMDASTGAEMEKVSEPVPLLEWLAENYQQFGAQLEFVTGKHASLFESVEYLK